MTTQVIPVPPASWVGSIPEWVVFEELNRRGLRDGVEFTYQSPLQGGRTQRGGVIIDFLFRSPPGLAINVQGEYFHHEAGASVIARDRLGRAQLAGSGITLIFIDAQDALSNPRFYVGEALRFRDHSFLSRGG
jgi:hypothetical protein